MTEITLEQLRQKIDLADEKLLHALAERMAVIKKVGKYKKKYNIPPLAPARWQQVLESKKALARELGLSETVVEELYNVIHEYALELEAKEK